MKRFWYDIKGSTWLIVTFLAFLAACSSDKTAAPDDWPQFKNDNYRSGNTGVQLDVSAMELDWVFEAGQSPEPAWYGPAKEDAYANSGPLPSMRDYDLAFYPIVVGSNLYYASSADDAIHCIDARSGKEKWHFTTNGPVRIAPTFYKGHLFFGSDDGFVYCVDAKKGKLRWKYSPVVGDHPLVLNNGRLISYWPVRTGVLIEDGKAYFGASLLPWKKSFFCAIDLKNGKPRGEGCYVKEFEGMTFEGALASTGSVLIQPQGRIAPVFIRKSNGENAGNLPGAGGCYVLVTPDKHIVHSQTSRHKAMVESVDEEQPEFMSFKGGKALVVKGDTSFILTDHSISAYHRQRKKMLWLRRNYQAHRIIMSNDLLLAGATDTVYAINPANGLPLWKGNVEGTVYALAAAGEKLYASTSEGKIYCFGAGKLKNPLPALNKSKPAVVEEKSDQKEETDQSERLVLKTGPFVEALSPHKVKLTFETEKPEHIYLEWGAEGYPTSSFQADNRTEYTFELPVRKGFIYKYTLANEKDEKTSFEYDNFFNYKRQIPDFTKMSASSIEVQNEVKQLLKLGGPVRDKGICMVFGLGDGQLPIELARRSNMDVVVLDESEDRVNDFRDRLQPHGVYGRKIAALPINDFNELPIAGELANIVYLANGNKTSPDQVIQMIAPRGFALVKGVSQEWLDKSVVHWQVDAQDYGDNGLLLKKHLPEVIGEWTHQYARADNSAFGGESFWGSTRAEDFEIRWMGRPGPRFQTDRSGRKPSPLAVEGRMFVQGNERVVAVDIYNGTILWAKDFVGLKRMNLPRDCSNWAADEQHIFMAIGQKLLKVDQTNGRIAGVFPVGKSDSDWGYISVLNDKIIGSAVPQGSNYTNFHGGAGWYDAQSGGLAYKVVSREIFAKDKSGMDKVWSYPAKGVIINSTITIYNDQISFVESHGVKLSPEDRGGDDLFATPRLVTLNVNTGKKIWEKRVNIQPGRTMFTMAAGGGKYVLVSSNDWKYQIATFDAGTGDLGWGREQKWFHGDHGGHFSRPAIANNRLVIKPAIYDLQTGEQTEYNVPKSGHGCASYALTEQSIFYRGGSVTQFNFDTREFSRWERLRPDCWISTIPAQGMVLSPEAGGGCSCGNWLETSMVMAPVSRAPLMIKTIVESKPDYKSESWGDYEQGYAPHEFKGTVQLEIVSKPGVDGQIRYTTDGSEPTGESTLYQGPITLQESCELNATIFTGKENRGRQYTRSKNYVRLDEGPPKAL